jgi:hypothetical protein
MFSGGLIIGISLQIIEFLFGIFILVGVEVPVGGWLVVGFTGVFGGVRFRVLVGESLNIKNIGIPVEIIIFKGSK